MTRRSFLELLPASCSVWRHARPAGIGPYRGRSAPPYALGAAMNAYADWLRDADTPTLMLWAKPGLLSNRRALRDAQRQIRNLDVVYLGKGDHFLPEDHPEAIAGHIEAVVRSLDR